MRHTSTQPQGLRIFSIASVAFGILGGAFVWWVPLGIVLSLAGLMFGISDAIIARRRSLTYRLAIAGLLISVVTLALGIVIFVLGLQIVTFGRS